MSLYFYLSYAKVDSSGYLQTLFDDLSDTIQLAVGVPRDRKVGFFDRREIQPGLEWGGSLADALQTSRTIISLLSPAYFQSERAGKEWQLFEMRKQLYLERCELGGANIDDPPQPIIPVNWIPCEGVPHIVTEARSSVAIPNGVYKSEGLLTMLKSPSRFRREYAEVVRALADQVIARAEGNELPCLDTLPRFNKVISAFSFTGEFSQKIRKYRAVIIEAEQEVRDVLVESLRFAGWDADGYDSTEEVWNRISIDTTLDSMPDLFLIDVESKHERMHGIELIDRLTDDNAPSAIIASYTNPSSSTLEEAIKMGATPISKPFVAFDHIERMEQLASIGMKRRLYRQGHSSAIGLDASRQRRPVFLSYPSADKKVASGLRLNIEARGIGVWYAPNTLEGGDDWRDEIEKGIDKASVFVPLITDNYSVSRYCVGELTRFRLRLKKETSHRLLLLPVLCSSAEEARRFVGDYQHVDLSSGRFVNGLTILLGRIQQAVGQHQ